VPQLVLGSASVEESKDTRRNVDVSCTLIFGVNPRSRTVPEDGDCAANTRSSSKSAVIRRPDQNLSSRPAWASASNFAQSTDSFTSSHI